MDSMDSVLEASTGFGFRVATATRWLFPTMTTPLSDKDSDKASDMDGNMEGNKDSGKDIGHGPGHGQQPWKYL